MLRSTKLTIELSKARERINALLDKTEALTDEERTERDGLAARLQELEPELRAALASEAAPAAFGPAVNAVVSRTSP